MTTPRDKWSVGGFVGAAAIGGVAGLAGGFAGAAGAKLLGPAAQALGNRLSTAMPGVLDSLLGRAATGAVTGAVVGTIGGAAGGAAAGAMSYAGGCISGGECSLSGLAASTAAGAASGAVGGAVAGGLMGGAAGLRSPRRGGAGDPVPEDDAPAGCAVHSFAAGTPVLLADGSSKPIGAVTIGDRVASTDPATGQGTAEPVVALHHHHDTDLADVTVQAGDGTTTVLHTTWHHPLWSDTEHRWVEAADLKPGTALHVWTGTTYAVTVVSVRTWTGLADMRDLTVAHVHTYYVVAGTTPVLVHNCDIVGTTHNAVRPTQDWIDPNQVDIYAARLRAGERLPPIDVQQLPDGRRFILDGHHRYVASQLVGIPVDMNITYGSGPIGWPDWTDVSYSLPNSGP